MTSSGIELATFWFVAYCLNQQRYRVPPQPVICSLITATRDQFLSSDIHLYTIYKCIFVSQQTHRLRATYMDHMINTSAGIISAYSEESAKHTHIYMGPKWKDMDFKAPCAYVNHWEIKGYRVYMHKSVGSCA
jgi:hypothetical protein